MSDLRTAHLVAATSGSRATTDARERARVSEQSVARFNRLLVEHEHTPNAREFERHTVISSETYAGAAEVHHHRAATLSADDAADSLAGARADAARLMERATQVLIEAAPRADQARIVVGLDHVLPSGACAEFVRDGAFLQLRLHARSETALRAMWAQRDALASQLAATTGLTARIEIIEAFDDGRAP
jgi:hypothetical protein